MKYQAKLYVPHTSLQRIEGFLNAENEDDFQGEDNTITYSAEFPNGYDMDIKCCGCQNDSSWTEAILFGPAKGGGLKGICCTDPSYEYVGEWVLAHKGNVYVVNVVDGGDIETSRCEITVA